MAKIIIAALIALVFQFVMMFITIKTKFATSEVDAMKIYKRVLFVVSAVLQWLAIAYLVWRGVLQFIADSPMTARDVVAMLFASLVIFQSYIILIFYWFYGRHIERLRKGMMQHIKITDAMLYDIEKLQKK
jgi:hypothetical protein